MEPSNLARRRKGRLGHQSPDKAGGPRLKPPPTSLTPVEAGIMN